MIEEHAQVIALDEHDSVWVETQRRSACGQCAANKGCGTATLSKVLGNKRSRVRTLNPRATPVMVGDEVVIGINEQALVRGSLVLYMLPLLFLFVFAFLGELLSAQLLVTNPDILPIVLGFLGLLLGFVWVRGFTRRIANDPRYQPVLLRRA
ncbi:MAG TPA: Fis family transcriptional regulator [Gammaproteobacteria bacterium]|nr:Fis family transcriptional regulator [Gammaproteobacteria bacterium]